MPLTFFIEVPAVRHPKRMESFSPGLRGGAIPSGLNPAALHPKKLVALGLEPAVSPISNRQNVAVTIAPSRLGTRRLEALRYSRLGNLRYDFVHGLCLTDLSDIQGY